ncbi:DUF6730 family protein [Maribacter dokdonensis]|uniref:DUF6730 family protein n=1 Tax=Maribacter dokdonensis TaxID=320912 RepID=UPI001C07FD7F|nr:DUF6730 family protein [Maribacter dokdonensis]MBU2900631.1 hypothetical protein [Maribacter dokdonensis]
MAKLDEITELLTEELEGFRKSIVQLERISGELKSSEVVGEISTIKRQLEDLDQKQDIHFQRSIGESRKMGEMMAAAKLTPKWLLALFCIASILTVLALGYFGYHFIQSEDYESEAFENGKEHVILDLKDYLDEHPEVYKDFQAWSKEQERVPNQK